MVKVVGVRFKTSSRIYYFDPLDLPFQAGDGVIVETSRGLEFGEVPAEPKEVEESEIVAPLKPVIRIATDEDRRLRAMYSAMEPEALALCEQKIRDHNLDMKLVGTEYIFNGSKIVFYFTADERVDFRELVKDLAYSLHTRIELRQIGVRDEAKMLGGLGPCGRPVCCNAFLDEFRPVSIKMAKEQNLSLSPTKISGLCGRLMCCLQYEQCVYETMKKVMPRPGKEINTVDGVGIVVENNAITERTKVRLTTEDGTVDVREYPYTHLGAVGEPLPEIALESKTKKPEENSTFAAARREAGSYNPRSRRSNKPAQTEQNDRNRGPRQEPKEPRTAEKSAEPRQRVIEKQDASDPQPEQKRSRAEKQDKQDRKPDKSDKKQDKPAKAEKKQEKQGKSEKKHDKQEKKHEKGEKGDKPEKKHDKDKSEKSEKPDKQDKPEKKHDKSEKQKQRPPKEKQPAPTDTEGEKQPEPSESDAPKKHRRRHHRPKKPAGNGEQTEE